MVIFFVNSADHRMLECAIRTVMKKSGEMTFLHFSNRKELEFLKVFLNMG
jgi:hypothetical protein